MFSNAMTAAQVVASAEHFLARGFLSAFDASGHGRRFNLGGFDSP